MKLPPQLSRFNIRRTLLGPVAAIALCAACGSDAFFEPEFFPGEYSIIAADGEMLPNYIDGDPSQGLHFRLLEATFLLDDSDTAKLIVNMELDGVTRPPDTLFARYYTDGPVMSFKGANIGNKGLVLENGDILFYLQGPCTECCERRLVELVASRSPGGSGTGAAGVEQVVGTYPMSAIDGVGFPFVEEDTRLANGDRVVLTKADTIWLHSDSTYQLAGHRYEIVFPQDGSPPDTTAIYTTRAEGPFRTSGDAVLIIFPLPLQGGEISHIWRWEDRETLLLSPVFNLWCPDGCPTYQPQVYSYSRRE